MHARTSLFALAPIVLAAACTAKTDTAATADTGATAAAGGTIATDAAAVRRTIEETNARFTEAFKRGDSATVMASYADDAIVMMPNEEASRGREGVRKVFRDMLSQMTVKDFKVTTDDVMVGGDLAVETGKYEWTLQPKANPNAKEVKDKGKFVTVWQRQSDGSWKIVRDIINSDLPAAKT
jgi:uncharacterized protein (TIGR02246 family)